LGIDPVPLKTCNWNCVYCQLGRTTPVVNECRDHFPPEDILAEVRETLERHEPGQIDWITFVGSGEPLLHASLGAMIGEVKRMTEIPVAVCTNGSLLFRREARDAVRDADALMPTLIAGSRQVYKRVSRPHPDVPFESYVGGLIAFSLEYEGHFWPEVMLVKGLNDTEPALCDIRRVLRQIECERVHITLPERATSETWVEPPDEEGLLRAIAILGDVAEVVHPSSVVVDLSQYTSVVDAAASVLERHPMREDDLRQLLARFGDGDVTRALSDLEVSGRIQIVDRLGVRFYCPAGSLYPDDARSRRSAPR
jgi:wyosine [tRNA(Phe)-imidazoG37] synthetase (radical SAM superfamily)